MTIELNCSHLSLETAENKINQTYQYLHNHLEQNYNHEPFYVLMGFYNITKIELII